MKVRGRLVVIKGGGWSMRKEQSSRRLCRCEMRKQVMAGAGQGSSPERGRGRVTVKGTQKEREGRRRDQAQRFGKKKGVHSEYGGLILSADSALGFLGVHEPRGAALGLRVPLLLHDVPL